MRAILKEDGIELNDNSLMLSPILKSCKYTTEGSGQVRLLIQLGMLNLLSDEIDEIYLDKNQPYLGLLFKTVLTLGYFGLMRIGEMTAVESHHTIKLEDVHVDTEKEKILIFLKLLKHTQELASHK